MKISSVILLMIVLAGWGSLSGQSVDKSKQVELKIKTTYDENGRPVNRGQSRKGWHRVSGSMVLTDGETIVTVNTSTGLGRQDVSFIDSTTYTGVAWSLDTTNTNRYWIIPLSGKSFRIKSSNGADVSTVSWKVEGE